MCILLHIPRLGSVSEHGIAWKHWAFILTRRPLYNPGILLAVLYDCPLQYSIFICLKCAKNCISQLFWIMARIREKTNKTLYRLFIFVHISNYQRKLVNMTYVRHLYLFLKCFAEYVYSVMWFKTLSSMLLITYLFQLKTLAWGSIFWYMLY